MLKAIDKNCIEFQSKLCKLKRAIKYLQWVRAAEKTTESRVLLVIPVKSDASRRERTQR